MIVRAERAADVEAITAVHRAAFPTDAEARLVSRLRARDLLRCSLVAEPGGDQGGEIVGSVVFTPVTLDGREAGLGLAPLAVLPSHQRRGVGSALVRAGLERCRALGAGFVVLLGDPAFYLRFGFERADRHGLQNEYGATDAFLVLALRPGGIPGGGGMVRYAPEFAEFGDADE